MKTKTVERAAQLNIQMGRDGQLSKYRSSTAMYDDE